MTRSLLRATTALTLSLSLLQPAYLSAQSLGEALADLEALEAICAEDPEAEGCDALLQLQKEAEAAVEAEPEPAEAAAEPEVEAVEDEVVEEAAEAPVEEVAEEPAAEEPVAAEPAEEVAEEVIEAPEEDVVAEEPVAEQPAEMEADAEVEAEAEAQPEVAAEEPAEAVTEETVAAPEEKAVAEEPAAEAEAEVEAAAEEAEIEAAAEAEAEAEGAVEAEASAPVTEADREASATLLSDPEVAEAAETLSQALSAVELDDATTDDDAAPLAGAAAALAALLRQGEGEDADAEAAEVVETELTEETTRSSAEEFVTGLSAQVDTTRPRDRGMSDLERAGLVALGALAVGVILSNGNRVVASSGDRVVVDRGDGNLALWKDDDALLRQPGQTQRVERFADGSTITRLDRADGTQIITIRDATGRVLRRARVELDGSQTLLIDDTQRFQPIEVSQLPRPRMAEVQLTEGSDPALVRALLLAAEQPEIGRAFSLRQVREVSQVRELAPEFSGTRILFATGSSAVRPDEAPKLLQLGRLMRDMIADNPREMFLIEGHTDAVGSAAFNLALSDRRAESVALALTEYFGVPPENMVVQGYGEDYLKIPTLEAEPENRRVAVRRITWLLAQR